MSSGRVLALALLGLQVDLAKSWGWSFDMGCCSSGNPMGGTCADGSVGPCCGVGKCNAMCCGCDGGCKQKRKPIDIIEITDDMKKLPLNQWPMLMAHDAAAAYAQSDTCSAAHSVNNWAVTQAQGGFERLLGCGARSFDLRPYLKKDGDLVMHHGAVVFHTPVETAIKDILDWVEIHPNTFILIQTGHCDGEDENLKRDCEAKTNELFRAHGVAELHCDDIARMTLGKAMDRGSHTERRGSVLYTWEWCTEANYDEKIQCYGHVLRKLESSEAARSLQLPNNASDVEGDDIEARRLTLAGTGSCYGSEGDRKTAFDPFWAYMDKHCNTPKPPFENRAWLWIAQAHWQYDEAAIAEGTARHSCILWDQEKSHMNKLVAEKIAAGGYKHLNIVQVDELCDHGQQMTHALHKHTLRKLDEFSSQRLFEQQSVPSVGVHAFGRSMALLAVTLVGFGAIAFGVQRLRRTRARRSLGSATLGDSESLVYEQRHSARDLVQGASEA